MTEKPDAAAYFEDTWGLAALWFGLVAGPAAWFMHLNVSYSLVRLICRTGEIWLLHLAAFTTLALAAIGLWAAWRSWTIARRSVINRAGGTMARSRFMALGGILLSGFFLTVILLAWLPGLMLDPCGAL